MNVFSAESTLTEQIGNEINLNQIAAVLLMMLPLPGFIHVTLFFFLYRSSLLLNDDIDDDNWLLSEKPSPCV